METLTFADHFSSPSMIAGTVVFGVLELFSVLLCVLVVTQYLRVISKHSVIPQSIRHDRKSDPKKGKMLLLQLYIVLTVIITIGAFLLFLLQPHLY